MPVSYPSLDVFADRKSLIFWGTGRERALCDSGCRGFESSGVHFHYGDSSNTEPTFAAPRLKVVPYSKPLLNTTIELCGLFGQLNSTVSVQALPPDGGASLKMVPQPV
jgi:hypothetical protein